MTLKWLDHDLLGSTDQTYNNFLKVNMHQCGTLKVIQNSQLYGDKKHKLTLWELGLLTFVFQHKHLRHIVNKLGSKEDKDQL